MATRRWKGDAVAVAQVTEIAVTGTWATGDTATLTINGKDLTLTVGSNAAVADVVAALAAMVNGDSAVDDETRSEAGSNVGEFARITASGSSSPLVLTSDDKGLPFTITASESTAGDGALGSPSTATAATGPHHFDNADNWTGGAVPVDGDDIVFDSGDVDVKHALGQSGVTPASISVALGYSGRIGLPEINADDTTLPYREYRETYLQLGNSGDAMATTIDVGGGQGSGSGRLKLDSGDGQAVLNVFGGGQRAESDVPGLLWKGTHADNEVNVSKGDVGIAWHEGESAHLATLRIGFLENQAGDASVVCGAGVDLANASIEQSGGTLSVASATGSGSVEVTGGELTILAGAHAALDIDGGEVFYRSTGTITTARVAAGGTLDFRRDGRPRTVTNCELHAGGSLLDPRRTVTFTNGIDLVRSSLAEVTLEIGSHLTLTPGDV